MNVFGKVALFVIAFIVLMLISGVTAGVFALFGAAPELVAGVWLGGAITNTAGLAVEAKRTWRSL